MDSGDFTLTLPGIAGIVLTMAMAVDTNVIIYERTKEELFAGKSILEAYKDGFKHALSAIIDGHSTTLLTACCIVLLRNRTYQRFCIDIVDDRYYHDIVHFCIIIKSNDLQQTEQR
jgi:SecD/SecF fusion protein